MFGDAEEKCLEMWFRQNKRLIRKRPFSNEALTVEEFSQKYWMDGEVPYQYHTMQIEDGKTEVEQLAYNNIRALKNDAVKQRRMMWEEFGEKQKQIDDCKKELAHIRKVHKSFMICAVIGALISISMRSTLRYRRSTQHQK